MWRRLLGESLAESVDVRADERVLDVAAGNGNATLAAARHFAVVTSTDYVPASGHWGTRRLARRAEFVGLPEQMYPHARFGVGPAVKNKTDAGCGRCRLHR